MERSGRTESGSGVVGIITWIGSGMAGSGRAALPGGGPRALLPSLCLLLALTPLLPTPARALPTPTPALPTPRHSLAEALNRSWDLLEAVSASLHRLKEPDILGFECTLEEVDPEDITENQINTIKACTSEDPGPGNCPALERSGFDERKCLQGIHEDLKAYRTELGNFSDHHVLETLDEMMKALGSSGDALEPWAGPGAAAGAGAGQGAAAGARAPSFQEKMRLCGVLQALRIRCLTICRMMNFLNSLESSL